MAEWLMAQQTKGASLRHAEADPEGPLFLVAGMPFPLPGTRYPSLRLVYSVLLNNSTDPVSISVANKPRNMRSGSSTLTAAPFNRSTRNACTA